jgi:hypothetical protein
MNRLLLVGLALLLPGVVGAQSTTLSALLDRLPTNQVTELDGQIYVRVVDQRRGATQGLERLLINRATVMAGHWLCNFSPKPNQRLEVSLQGVNLVHSQESGGSMDVVIRLKKQKPDCVVQTVAAPPPAVSSPSTANLPVSAPAAIPPVSVPAPAVALPSPSPVSPPFVAPASAPTVATQNGAPADTQGGGFKVRAYSKEY